jgi:hypothetical protein
LNVWDAATVDIQGPRLIMRGGGTGASGHRPGDGCWRRRCRGCGRLLRGRRLLCRWRTLNWR